MTTDALFDTPTEREPRPPLPRTLAFDVIGTPAAQGSKKGFYNKKTGRVQQVEVSKKVEPWRIDVKKAATAAIEASGHRMFTGPVEVHATYYLHRPKSHFRTGRDTSHLLRETAPHWVATRPDIEKIVRSTHDALTEAAVWHDDCLAVRIVVEKRFADHRPPGAHIEVRPLP